MQFIRQIFDIPVSITIIPDCFPALFDLMERRYGGPLNLVNPEPISLHRIVQLYKEHVDPNMEPWEGITMDSVKGRELMATKGNCALDTKHFLSMCPNVPSSSISIIENLKKISKRISA